MTMCSAEVVDSYLLDEGKVAGWREHESRFLAMAVAAGAEERAVAAFLAQLRRELPRRGRWFPKISFDSDSGKLDVDVRPAPRLRTESTLWLPEAGDPRVAPRVKGPDLPVLAALRAQAQELGADDAVLHRGGEVSEAAHGTLLLFDGTGGGESFVPGAGQEVLESITLRRTAAEIDRRRVAVAALPEYAAWLGSSLHGWTPVTQWVLANGERRQACPAPPTADCNAALWEAAETFPEG